MGTWPRSVGVWTQDRLLKDRFDRGRLDMEYILEMKDIHKSFGPVKVLEGIDSPWYRAR